MIVLQVVFLIIGILGTLLGLVLGLKKFDVITDEEAGKIKEVLLSCKVLSIKIAKKVRERIVYIAFHPVFKISWIGLLVLYLIGNVIICCLGFTIDYLETGNIYLPIAKVALLMSCVFGAIYCNIRLMNT